MGCLAYVIEKTICENAIELFKELEDNESRVKATLSLGIAHSRMNHDETFKAL